MIKGLWEKEILVNAVKYCNNCKHRYPHGIKCDAFPDRIPTAVLIGDIDHRLPIDGDHGIQYEPKEEEK